MDRLKDVISGLECAIDKDHFGFKKCHSCKYRKDIDHFQYVCDGDRCIAEAIELLEELSMFKEYFDGLYGQGLQIAGWHMNGELESFDSFYESAVEVMSHDG